MDGTSAPDPGDVGGGVLEVVRRGGIAGVPARATVDLAALPPETARAVRDLLRDRAGDPVGTVGTVGTGGTGPAGGAGAAAAAAPAPWDGRADAFTYELSLGGAGGGGAAADGSGTAAAGAPEAGGAGAPARSALLPEHELPQELGPLLEALRPRWVLGR